MSLSGRFPNESQRRELMELAQKADVNAHAVHRAITNIQAAMRGKLVRIRMKRIARVIREREEIAGFFEPDISEDDIFFNKLVKQIYEREGAFETPDVPSE